MKKVGVIGAGAWGTAVAVTVSRAGGKVLLWALEEEVVASVNGSHENTVFLPGIPLPDAITATGTLEDMLSQEALFLVTPAQFLRSTCKQLKAIGLPKNIPLILCSKGIEKDSLKLTSEVVQDELPNPIAILSGPTFADEVAKGLPASATLAAEDKELAEELAHVLESGMFKVFVRTDIIGAQISGTVKNVIAIACGIAEAKGLGENAKAALITRGLAEARRLCIAKGGKAETLLGLCGVGDMILTCGSHKSRNMSLGFALGSGESLEDIMKKRRTVAEGVVSSESVTRLSEVLGVETPVCAAVYMMLHKGAHLEKTVRRLVRYS